MKEIESIFLIATDADKNNNKFWKGVIYENDSGQYEFHSQHGRVGATPRILAPKTFPTFAQAKKLFDSKVRDKKQDKPGKRYRESEILESRVTVNPIDASSSLEQIAYDQISFDQKDKTIKDLIDKLVKANIHQLTTSSYDIQINNQGMAQTAIGIVSENVINEAQGYLDQMMEIWSRRQETLWKTKEVIRLNELYYNRIPKKYKHIEDVLILTKDQIEEAYDFCEQLKQTVAFYESSKKDEVEKASKNGTIKTEKVFDLAISLIPPTDSEFKRISKKFESEKNRMHGGRINSCNVRNVYAIEIKPVKKAFDGCTIGNINEYWHGTKASNILSILKSGLFLPDKLSRAQITGSMYSSGLYFSDQSTKSLQYSYGVAPGQSGYQTNMFFMFLANVRMGKSYYPDGPDYNAKQNTKAQGCDSCFAKAGKAGVRNNEMVVYQTNQVNLTYLIEFEEK